ncbi:MAG: hypothetical protein H7Y86_18890 [Rhizobacter sp.]|nr:hypothetical protein [Ferruginibacter sp.]
MEKLLTSYLYSFKACPLPTVGSLIIQPGAAIAEQSERKLMAPVPHIQFVSKEINAEGLLQYISLKKNIDIQQASDELSSYCDRLQQMQPYEEINLDAAGTFYTTEEGELHFKYTLVPAAFLPEVPAERVIHPDASHSMLVGDTQTNTTTMAELLDSQETSHRPKWIWAAIGLGVAGLLAITFYYMNRQPGSNFGNSATIKATNVPASYQYPGK